MNVNKVTECKSYCVYSVLTLPSPWRIGRTGVSRLLFLPPKEKDLSSENSELTHQQEAVMDDISPSSVWN